MVGGENNARSEKETIKTKVCVVPKLNSVEIASLVIVVISITSRDRGSFARTVDIVEYICFYQLG